MSVDERVDDSLVGGLDLLELDAHADPAVAPGHASFSVDVPLGPRHAKTHFDFGGAVERTGRPNRDAAVAQVERQRGGDGIAEAILNRDAEDDAGARAAVEVVGKKMR